MRDHGCETIETAKDREIKKRKLKALYRKRKKSLGTILQAKKVTAKSNPKVYTSKEIAAFMASITK